MSAADKRAALKIASEVLNEVAGEVLNWSLGPENRGPFEQELYRTNGQIATALQMCADRLKERLDG